MVKGEVYKYINEIKLPKNFTVFSVFCVKFSINITFDYSLVNHLDRRYYQKHYKKFSNRTLYLRDGKEVDDILLLFDDDLNCIDLKKFLKYTSFGSYLNFYGVNLEHIKNISITRWDKSLYNKNVNPYGMEHIQFVIRRNKR